MWRWAGAAAGAKGAAAAAAATAGVAGAAAVAAVEAAGAAVVAGAADPWPGSRAFTLWLGGVHPCRPPHPLHRVVDPHLLSEMASCDVASVVRSGARHLILSTTSSTLVP